MGAVYLRWSIVGLQWRLLTCKHLGLQQAQTPKSQENIYINLLIVIVVAVLNDNTITTLIEQKLKRLLVCSHAS